MPLQFNNVNAVWASVLVETLYRLGLTTAVICPGSRSTPLAIAFAQHPAIDAIPVLDERSAAFFALGIARRAHRSTVLVCTSGTAGANAYPAVIEARESRIPLLVLTADRPPELRDCNAGQTIDQQKLYGTYPNWYAELTVPAPDLPLLRYLRQTLIQAWERSLHPIPGPVHLNLPFRDPLAPLPQPAAQALETQVDWTAFFHHLPPTPHSPLPAPYSPTPPLPTPPLPTPRSPRGLLIAGVAHPADPLAYCKAIARLSKQLGVPVLAEGLSPVRNYADIQPYLITTYDAILRNSGLAEALVPDWVVRLGEMPTSKELRTWLDQWQPQQWVVDRGDRNLDPLHLPTIHLRGAVDDLLVNGLQPSPQALTSYTRSWLAAEAHTRHALDAALAATTDWFEGKVAWVLSRSLPAQTPVMIANSMPVRDVEWFWSPNASGYQPLFNRGANGIDGTVSTAMGAAHRHRATVLLTGDLTLLHDTNGLLLRTHLVGHLTIILINNNGGGIFEMLPISQFDPPFEAFFATPQGVEFHPLCRAYGIDHEVMQSWEHLIQRLNPLPSTGVRVLEVRTNRKLDAQRRRELLRQASELAPLE